MVDINFFAQFDLLVKKKINSFKSYCISIYGWH